MNATPSHPDVTVIVPAYNEEATIREVLERVLALPISMELILVDDGSTDLTSQIATSFQDRIVYIRKDNDHGKGAAIRTALQQAKGQVTIIQDADLEYNPEEIPQIVAPIINKEFEVVFGSRFSKGMPKGMALPNRIVNKLLAWMVYLLFFRKISDEATCYKAFTTRRLKQMNLTCKRFEFCPEVTAKAIRMGLKILEVPISYKPRTNTEGKKIRWTDGVEAIWTLIKHRFSKFR